MAYNNVDDCQADRLTVYRIYEGEANGECISFSEYKDGVVCAQFWDGGAERTDCTPTPLTPLSVSVHAKGPAECTFYSDEQCEAPTWEAREGMEGCQYSPPTGFFHRSFKCTVSNLCLHRLNTLNWR